VVLKPAELAPLSVLRLGALVLEAGFPPGVVNVVVGEGDVAGRALIEHPAVRMVSFTGSTRVGREVVAASARGNLKRFVLELGGKSPVLVFADADLEAASAAIAREIVFKSGQYCGAGTRLFVERPVFGEVVEAVAARLEGFRMGSGLGGADFGPLISERQRARVVGLVEAAVAAGAEPRLAGGVAGPGHFHAPVLLTGAGRGMGVYDEEVFGPVLCARPFEPGVAPEVLAAEANDTDYGLSAKVWTRDVGRVLRLARLLQAGNVLVNGGGGEKALPFGGFKLSGFGRENGREGIHAFTELKTVRIGI
jgi:phenylacetaldehyde dehydrogenase